ncbi:MAG: hypothetical protein BMS9Abin13_337 [Patescibacteria group bacterium]|nr:MAG: hypothetical protein BMS9Abin13_337 [Patescibacteria group bacterium]
MDEVDTFLAKVNEQILNPLIMLLFALAIVYFLWGTFEFIRDYDSVDARDKGKKHMVWGIIGIFIMVAVFGIMRLIASTFGIDTSVIPR